MAQAAIAAEIAMLMARYSFDLGAHSSECWIDQWLQQYPALWMQGAVVEALYQGRYKAVSVWQILDLWQRRGKPLRHFSREFERMVAGRTLPLLFTPDGAGAEPEIAQPVLLQPDRANQNAPLILPTAAFSEGQPQIPPYKPSSQFHLALPEKISLPQNLSRALRQPIQQFVPTPKDSELHSKLKSIAEALIMTNAQIISANLAAQSSQPATAPTISELEKSEPAPEQPLS